MSIPLSDEDYNQFDEQQHFLNSFSNHYFHLNDSDIFNKMDNLFQEIDNENKSTSSSNIEGLRNNEEINQPFSQEYNFHDRFPKIEYNENDKKVNINETSSKPVIEINIQLKEEEDEIKEKITSQKLNNCNIDKKRSETNESNKDNISTTLGKKRSNTKYNDDNLRRKCKHILFDTLFDFINRKISELYNNKIGQGICKKQLRGLNQDYKTEGYIKYNQDLLNKTIGEIFSGNITGRITSLPPDYNKKIIQSLITEEDISKRNYFTNLFNLTLIQCLGHFRGTENHIELEGMIDLNEKLKSYLNEKDYEENLKYYFKNYEKILKNKKPRKRDN